MYYKFDVCVMLPSRGRTDSLTNSITTILDKAKNPDKICLALGFDDDDQIGIDYFVKSVKPMLDQRGAHYKALTFKRMGYDAINRYYNELGNNVHAEWYFLWNDDATMITQDWDEVIVRETGNFALLKVHTHNEHPYSIFPIIPQRWLNHLGYFSRHQMIDAELSQNAYMLDIIKIVDIEVQHDQSELTGTNDATSMAKRRFEGNPSDPRDFHNQNILVQRLNDCVSLANLMKEKGLSTEFFENIVAGKQDPWEKLKLNDINKQMVQFQLSRPQSPIAATLT